MSPWNDIQHMTAPMLAFVEVKVLSLNMRMHTLSYPLQYSLCLYEALLAHENPFLKCNVAFTGEISAERR